METKCTKRIRECFVLLKRMDENLINVYVNSSELKPRTERVRNEANGEDFGMAKKAKVDVPSGREVEDVVASTVKKKKLRKTSSKWLTKNSSHTHISGKCEEKREKSWAKEKENVNKGPGIVPCAEKFQGLKSEPDFVVSSEYNKGKVTETNVREYTNTSNDSNSNVKRENKNSCPNAENTKKTTLIEVIDLDDGDLTSAEDAKKTVPELKRLGQGLPQCRQTTDKSRGQETVNDEEFEKVLEEVSGLVKHLHNSNKVIQNLKEDMEVNLELKNHFIKVIQTQQEKFRRDISKSQKTILCGYDKMMEKCTNPSDVALRISRKSLLTVEEVDSVISRCILIEDTCRKQRPGSEPGKFEVTCSAGVLSVDFSDSLKVIQEKLKGKEIGQDGRKKGNPKASGQTPKDLLPRTSSSVCCTGTDNSAVVVNGTSRQTAATSSEPSKFNFPWTTTQSQTNPTMCSQSNSTRILSDVPGDNSRQYPVSNANINGPNRQQYRAYSNNLRGTKSHKYRVPNANIHGPNSQNYRVPSANIHGPNSQQYPVSSANIHGPNSQQYPVSSANLHRPITSYALGNVGTRPSGSKSQTAPPFNARGYQQYPRPLLPPTQHLVQFIHSPAGQIQQHSLNPPPLPPPAAPPPLELPRGLSALPNPPVCLSQPIQYSPRSDLSGTQTVQSQYPLLLRVLGQGRVSTSAHIPTQGTPYSSNRTTQTETFVGTNSQSMQRSMRPNQPPCQSCNLQTSSNQVRQQLPRTNPLMQFPQRVSNLSNGFAVGPSQTYVPIMASGEFQVQSGQVNLRNVPPHNPQPQSVQQTVGPANNQSLPRFVHPLPLPPTQRVVYSSGHHPLNTQQSSGSQCGSGNLPENGPYLTPAASAPQTAAKDRPAQQSPVRPPSPPHHSPARPTDDAIEILNDPTVPQKLMMKDQRLQAGDALISTPQKNNNLINEVVIKEEESEEEEEVQIIGETCAPYQKTTTVRVRMCAQADCTNIGVRICETCRSVIYCGETCQAKHWKQKHGDECHKLKELLGG